MLDSGFVGVKRQVSGDLFNRIKWLFISPNGIFDHTAFRSNTEVAGLAFIGASGALVGGIEERHGHIFAWEIDGDGIVPFVQL